MADFIAYYQRAVKGRALPELLKLADEMRDKIREQKKAIEENPERRGLERISELQNQLRIVLEEIRRRDPAYRALPKEEQAERLAESLVSLRKLTYAEGNFVLGTKDIVLDFQSRRIYLSFDGEGGPLEGWAPFGPELQAAVKYLLAKANPGSWKRHYTENNEENSVGWSLLLEFDGSIPLEAYSGKGGAPYSFLLLEEIVGLAEMEVLRNGKKTESIV